MDLPEGMDLETLKKFFVQDNVTNDSTDNTDNSTGSNWKKAIDWLTAQIARDVTTAMKASSGITLEKARAVAAAFPEGEDHINEWDPSRVVMEMASKRGLLLLAARDDMPEILTIAIIKILLMPYMERPGFRPEWIL